VTLHLVKPSIRRVIWSITAVVVTACVVTGIALTVGLFTGHHDNENVPTGEFVRLVIMCLTIWGPMYLLIAWQISIPVIIALGALAAAFAGILLPRVSAGNAQPPRTRTN
jgi:hypothetical protein